jgi:hypothetical protein
VGSGECEYFYEIEYSQEGDSKLLYCNLTTWFDVVITKVRFFAEIDGKVKEVYHLGSLLKIGGKST